MHYQIIFLRVFCTLTLVCSGGSQWLRRGVQHEMCRSLSAWRNTLNNWWTPLWTSYWTKQGRSLIWYRHFHLSLHITIHADKAQCIVRLDFLRLAWHTLPPCLMYVCMFYLFFCSELLSGFVLNTSTDLHRDSWSLQWSTCGASSPLQHHLELWRSACWWEGAEEIQPFAQDTNQQPTRWWFRVLCVWLLCGWIWGVGCVAVEVCVCVCVCVYRSCNTYVLDRALSPYNVLLVTQLHWWLYIYWYIMCNMYQSLTGCLSILLFKWTCWVMCLWIPLKLLVEDNFVTTHLHVSPCALRYVWKYY